VDRSGERRRENRSPDQRRSDDGRHRHLCQRACHANATLWRAQPRRELCRSGEAPVPTPNCPTQVRWTENCVRQSTDRHHVTSPSTSSTVMLSDRCRMIAPRVSRCVRAHVLSSQPWPVPWPSGRVLKTAAAMLNQKLPEEPSPTLRTHARMELGSSARTCPVSGSKIRMTRSMRKLRNSPRRWHRQRRYPGCPPPWLIHRRLTVRVEVSAVAVR
jgi:hypothetical protein